MDEMPATSLLSDTDDVVRGIDLLERIIIDLGDVTAEHAKFFETAWTCQDLL